VEAALAKCEDVSWNSMYLHCIHLCVCVCVCVCSPSPVGLVQTVVTILLV